MLLCAVLLVAGSVLGTLAYLTSKSAVTNTFTVGNVELGGENEAGLDEAKVDQNGVPQKKDPTTGKDTPASVAEAYRVQANTYKLQPGKEYTKDPTIHIGDNSDDCYLFVKVVNEIVAIEDSTNTIADQVEAKGWKKVDDSTIVDGVYVYVGTAQNATAPLKVGKSTDITVFEKFKIKSDVDGDTLKGYANKTIVVTAYAVQADGFESSTAVEIITAAFTELVQTVPAE